MKITSKTRLFLQDLVHFRANQLTFLRLVIVLIALAIDVFTDVWIFVVIGYPISHYLDMWDGHVARSRKECSRFGALLDFYVDHVTEVLLACLIVCECRPAMLFFLIHVPLGFIGPVLCGHFLADPHYGNDWKTELTGKHFFTTYPARLVFQNGTFTRVGDWVLCLHHTNLAVWYGYLRMTASPGWLTAMSWTLVPFTAMWSLTMLEIRQGMLTVYAEPNQNVKEH